VDDLADSIPKDNLVDAFRNLCQWNGKTYGVGHSPRRPSSSTGRTCSPRRPQGAAHVDELVQVAEALKEVRDGQVVRWGLTMTGQPLFINIAVGELLRTNGGRLFDAAGRPTLTEKPVLELLDFYKKLGRVLPPGWTGHSYLDTFANLANDKAAMLYQAYGRGVGYIEKYAAKTLRIRTTSRSRTRWSVPRAGRRRRSSTASRGWSSRMPRALRGGGLPQVLLPGRELRPVPASVPIHLLSIKKSTSRNRDTRTTR